MQAQQLDSRWASGTMRGGWAGWARVVQGLTAAGLLGLALLVVVLVGQGVAAARDLPTTGAATGGGDRRGSRADAGARTPAGGLAVRALDRSGRDPRTDRLVRDLVTATGVLAAPALPAPWERGGAASATSAALPQDPGLPGVPGSQRIGIVPQWSQGVPPRLMVASLEVATDIGDPGQGQTLKELGDLADELEALGHQRIVLYESLGRPGEPSSGDPAKILRQAEEVERREREVQTKWQTLNLQDDAETSNARFRRLAAERDASPSQWSTVELEKQLDQLVAWRAEMVFMWGARMPEGPDMHPELRERLAAATQKLETDLLQQQSPELREVRILGSIHDQDPEQLWSRAQFLRSQIGDIDEAMARPEDPPEATRALLLQRQDSQQRQDLLPSHQSLAVERAALTLELAFIEQKVPFRPDLLNLPREQLTDRQHELQAQLDALKQQRAKELGDPPELGDSAVRRERFWLYERALRSRQDELDQLDKALEHTSTTPPAGKDTRVLPDSPPDASTRQAGAQEPAAGRVDTTPVLQADIATEPTPPVPDHPGTAAADRLPEANPLDNSTLVADRAPEADTDTSSAGRDVATPAFDGDELFTGMTDPDVALSDVGSV